MFQDKTSNIRSINIVEDTGGGSAVVEMTLADVQSIDDAEEYIVFAVRVDYQRPHPFLEEIKKEAISRARTVLTHETKRIQDSE